MILIQYTLLWEISGQKADQEIITTEKLILFARGNKRVTI